MTTNIIPQRNLYHLFKRTNVSAEDINKYINKYPKTERRIGTLPIDWLKNLPKDEFSAATEKIDAILHKFAKNAEKSPKFDELYPKLIKSLKKILRRDDITIKFEDLGAYKYCQRLTVGDYTYALSTFKPLDKASLCAKNPRHGPFAEPQKVFWAYKNSPHGRMAKPFMARFCTDKDKGGYILSKFIDVKDIRRAKMPLNPFRDRFYQVFHMDNFKGKNVINGVCVDMGGIIENASFKDEMANKEFKHNLFVFLDRIAASLYKRDFSAEKLLLEQIKNGNDIFTMDFRTIKSENSRDTVREAIRMVRRLRSVHKLKLKLEKEGEFEYYRQLLSLYSGHYTRLLHYEIDGLI